MLPDREINNSESNFCARIVSVISLNLALPHWDDHKLSFEIFGSFYFSLKFFSPEKGNN